LFNVDSFFIIKQLEHGGLDGKIFASSDFGNLKCIKQKLINTFFEKPIGKEYIIFNKRSTRESHWKFIINY